MRRETLATLTFAGFALLLAFRDVATELSLSGEKRLWLSFTVCSTILALSAAHVLFARLRGRMAAGPSHGGSHVAAAGARGLVRKLRTPGAMPRAMALGLFSGGIYLGIFYLIGKLTAGVWGLIDYGLIPLATAIVGWAMFRERLTRDFFGAFAVYLLGLTILMVTTQEIIGASLLGIAILIPVASALSDGYTKWLLSEDNAGLTKAELLVVRFLPAAAVLFVLAAATSKSLVPQINDPYKTVAVAVVGGWVPLMLLCTGLGRAGMEKLAVWEFTIPAVTFFGTLYVHPERVGLPILGALLILSGIVVSEWKLVSRLTGGGGGGLDLRENFLRTGAGLKNQLSHVREGLRTLHLRVRDAWRNQPSHVRAVLRRHSSRL